MLLRGLPHEGQGGAGVEQRGGRRGRRGGGGQDRGRSRLLFAVSRSLRGLSLCYPRPYRNIFSGIVITITIIIIIITGIFFFVCRAGTLDLLKRFYYYYYYYYYYWCY
jgi:hypothetical protein